MLLLVGALLYFVGTFLVTMFFNVPLNDALAAVAPDSSEGASLWSRYLINLDELEPRADDCGSGGVRIAHHCALSAGAWCSSGLGWVPDIR